MAAFQFRGSGIFPLMLLLLLLAERGYAEEHSHRHQHNGTTSAPPVHSRRNQLQQQQQRLLQLQQAQDGIDFGIGNGIDNLQHHHHLRHEQHLRAELAGNGNRQPPIAGTARQPVDRELSILPGTGQQHHLRHHNRHHAAWEQRVFPALRHQQHRWAATSTAAPISTTTANTEIVTDAPQPHLAANLSSSAARYFDRDGIYPEWTHSQRSTLAPNWQQQFVDSAEDDDDDDDDDEDYDEDEADADDYKLDIKKATELAKQMPRYSLFSQKLPKINSNEQDYDAYDESDTDSEGGDNNRHPSVSAGHAKAAAKRNIFDWIFKRDQDKQQTPATPQIKIQTKLLMTTEKPKHVSLQDNSLTVEDAADSADNAAEAFSNEQWNKIEHEHHLQQQKHQKELQALRDSNRNTPLIRGSGGRGAIDNEDADSNNNFGNNYIAGKLTHQKIEQLGTQEAVHKTRRVHHRSDMNERALAEAHRKRVMNEATCHVPQKRCMSVQKDPSKLYSPHCTTLHRCTEDSGCCPTRSEICAAKRTHNVELYFNVKGIHDRFSKVEKLNFVNHTECHCIERSNYNADIMASSALTTASCNCPTLFEKILQNDGHCRCDCSSSNYHCKFLKAGREHFSMIDRICIHEGRCKLPTCQFGTYIEGRGSCPKENEQQSHQSSYNAINMS